MGVAIFQIHSDLSAGHIPCVRRVDELEVA